MINEKKYNQLVEKIQAVCIKENVNYFLLQCSCCHGDAFLYKNALREAGAFARIHCNRKNKCGHTENIFSKFGDELTEFKRDDSVSRELKQNLLQVFEQHGLDLDTLLKAGVVGFQDNALTILLTFCQGKPLFLKLRQIEKKGENKWVWTNPRSAVKPLSKQIEYLPPFEPSDANPTQIFIMDGVWDWLLANADGIPAATSLFGCSYVPKWQGCNLLGQYKKIVIVPDQTRRERSAAMRLADALYQMYQQKTIHLLHLPFPKEGGRNGKDGKDYCDWRKENEAPTFLRLSQVKYEPPAELEDLEIFEQRGKTYCRSPRVSKGEVCDYIVKEIANFTMRIEEKIIENEEVILKITLSRGFESVETTTFLLKNEACSSVYKFRENLCKRGMFFIRANLETFDKFMLFVEKKSNNIRVKKKMDCMGRLEGKKEFLFSNKVAVPGGARELNEYVPLSRKMRLELPDNLKRFWQLTITDLTDLYYPEFWKVLGFAAATVFADEIERELRCFPLLFVTGPSKSGKSTLCHIVTRLFGAEWELRPLNFAATAKAKIALGASFRGVPLTLNEYRASQANNMLLQSLYDREGGVRKRFSNDRLVEKDEINSTYMLISTRAISGYEAEAVASRCVTVDFTKIERNNVTAQIMRDIVKRKYLSSFVSLVLQLDPNKVLVKMREEAEKIWSENLQLEARYIENHAVLGTFAKALFELLEIAQYTKVQGVDAVCETQQTTNDANPAYLFLNLLRSEIENNKILSSVARIDLVTDADGEVLEEILYFRFQEVYPQVLKVVAQTAQRGDLPDLRTLRNNLKDLGCYEKKMRLDQVPRRVLCYHITHVDDT